MTLSKEYLDIQRIFLLEKNTTKAIESLKESENFKEHKFQELYADILFTQNDFTQSATIYEKLGEYYKLGYCYFLYGDINNAKLIWENCPHSPAQNWGLFFCQLFSEKVTITPTYLQIRAFLERDLAIFLKLNLVEYVQKILDISEFLFEINPETNKIIARTFLHNNYLEYTKEYLKRGFDFTSEDAELYYLSGLYFAKNEEYIEAKSALKKALLINENYFPAKKLLISLE